MAKGAAKKVEAKEDTRITFRAPDIETKRRFKVKLAKNGLTADSVLNEWVATWLAK